jgi:hypothetical protein
MPMPPPPHPLALGCTHPSLAPQITASILLYSHSSLPAPAPPAPCQPCSLSAMLLLSTKRPPLPPSLRYELLPREPDTPSPDVQVLVDGSGETEEQQELHHRRQIPA